MEGMRLGLNCIACCAGLTAVLLVNGVMDLRTMALVTLAISAERLAPAPERVAQVIGVVVIVLGLSMLAHAIGVI
jgi:predicted metal-binding membrane protein